MVLAWLAKFYVHTGVAYIVVGVVTGTVLVILLARNEAKKEEPVPDEFHSVVEDG